MGLTADEFAAAYARHASRILAYCRLRAGDAAEDVAQQVWCEAWERRASYEDRGWPMTAWLFRIAQSRCADVVRDSMRRPTVPLGDRHATPDAYSDVEAYQDAADLLRRAQLVPGQHRAIALRMHGLELREIGAVMGVSIGSVKALISRAKTHLRAARGGAMQEPRTRGRRPKAAGPRDYSHGARELILTHIALSGEPVHHSAFAEHCSPRSGPVMVSRLARLGELTRVRAGVYDLGPHAPEWAQLLRKHREVIGRG